MEESHAAFAVLAVGGRNGPSKPLLSSPEASVIRIRRVDRSHPLYPQSVDLRTRVLLDPIGLSLAEFSELFPGFEERFEHFVAFVEHPKGPRVVGVVCLLPNFPEQGVAKLMQMAVDPQRQREWIGRKLVVELEKRAFGEMGVRRLFCHAREEAAKFYAQLGWEIEGEPFDEAGIRHFKMTLEADRPDSPGDTDAE